MFENVTMILSVSRVNGCQCTLSVAILTSERNKTEKQRVREYQHIDETCPESMDINSYGT